MRWPVVLLTLAISLAALFGTGYLVQNRTVNQPLLQALSRMEQLESYEVSHAGETQEIALRLRPDADLKQAYADVDSQVRQILKQTPYRIRIEDQRSPDFVQAADRIELYVQEAMATGEFAAMADRVQEEARQLGAEARVAVDNQRVYVSLRRDEAYMYDVVERPTSVGAVRTGGGVAQ